MRNFAFDIVYSVLERGEHSDAVFHRIVNADMPFSAQDKSFIKRISYGTIERRIETDARINATAKIPVRKMDARVRTILRMAMYEICYMEQIPEAVSCNEAVELAKQKGVEKYASFVNGVLRNSIREKDFFQIKDDWVRYSLPEELMEYFTVRYGKKTAVKIAKAFLDESGYITLHIDTNKISAGEYIEKLKQREIECRPGYYMRDAVITKHISDVRSLPGYKEGLFFVQDESSMLPVLSAGIRPGMRVADVCSAPGGKSIHTLMKLSGQGQLFAGDVTEEKIRRVRDNIRRMGYSNVVCECRDASVEDAGNQGTMDVVLADVPCSGIGIIGRKPEIKYRALLQVETLVPLQRKICREASKLLKPGGVFVYSTCTINQKENEENVKWIEENLKLRRTGLDEYIPDMLKNKMTKEGMLQILPGIHHGDGFFVARFVRVA